MTKASVTVLPILVFFAPMINGCGIVVHSNISSPPMLRPVGEDAESSQTGSLSVDAGTTRFAVGYGIPLTDEIGIRTSLSSTVGIMNSVPEASLFEVGVEKQVYGGYGHFGAVMEVKVFMGSYDAAAMGIGGRGLNRFGASSGLRGYAPIGENVLIWLGATATGELLLAVPPYWDTDLRVGNMGMDIGFYQRGRIPGYHGYFLFGVQRAIWVKPSREINYLPAIGFGLVRDFE